MPAPATTTTHAVLGLLRLRSWTTYELAKQVQRSLGWFWPRAERKLYEEPKRLAVAGLATSEHEMTGSRPRTVYAITGEGRSALKRWLAEPPVPPTLEFEGMVKVFFADGGTLKQLRATLAAIAETADARLADLAEKGAEHDRPDVPFPERVHLNALCLRFHTDHERLVGDWARWALDQVGEWPSTRNPGDWDRRAATATAGH